MKQLPLWLLWLATQLIALILAIVGVPVCAWLAWRSEWWADVNNDRWHWHSKWAWLWDNDEDGVCPYFYKLANPKLSYARCAFYWTALRNPVNNLRFVRGVSRPDGPYKLVTWRGFGRANRGYYAHAGYKPPQGWPVLSFGKS